MTTTPPGRRDQSTVTMKALEAQYRTVLPEISKYTRRLQRPFDPKFTADMQARAQYLCENIDGAQFAYTQSDEIPW